MSLFTELKRRNVFRVGIAYAITGWLLAQVADVFLENFGAPDWVIKTALLAILIGFPVALLFAWAFELTPEGIKREKEIDRSTSITPKTGRKLDRAIIVLLALGLAYFAWESRFANREPAPADPTPTAAATSSEKSIAVLPFADLSQNQDQGWFADGLAEEILNALAKTPDLLVSSRTSSFKYKGSDLDISQIAAELGVAHVLEGSVRSGGDRIRVTAQLIRASDGFHVWSENYDRDLADMISIQEDLARNIARALETTMDPAALAEMSSVGTRSVAAYEEYLRGVDLDVQAWQTATGFEQRKAAHEHYERAREIDPGFAKAHFRAADFWKTHLDPTRTDFGDTGLTPLERRNRFEDRIERAIDTAPNETEKKLYVATRAMVGVRLNEAVDLLVQYLDERPNDSLAENELITVAQMSSRKDVLVPIFEKLADRAMTDTYSASSFVSSAWRVLDPRRAAPDVLRIADRWPDSAGVMYQVHRSLLWAERFDEADRIAAHFRSLTGEPNPIFDARRACVAGDREQAEAILSQLDASRTNEVSLIWHILMLLGRDREAAELLMPLDASGVPYQLASWLVYPQFDPSPFPNLQRVLLREGIERPAPAKIPFKCPAPERPSIAVLPFRDMSAAQDQAYFGEGIAEELLNALVKLDGIKVASRTSAFSLADDDLDIPSIAQRLGVNHILEGSVRTSGNQVRVTAQLIDVNEDVHLWSETYDGKLDDIFQIQDEITGKITEAMKVQFADNVLASAAEELTGNAEAYQLYLKGRHFWRQRSSAGLRMAVELLEEATRLDPGFHRAWSNLAIAYENLPVYDRSFDEGEYRVLSKEAAQKALDINPDSSEALAMMADIAASECRVAEAIRMYRHATASDPNDATSHHWYGLTILSYGRVEEALANIRIAREIDPLISAVISVESMVHIAKGDYGRALALAEEASALGMESGVPYYQGQIHAAMGHIDQARELMTVTGPFDRGIPPELIERFLESMENPALAAELTDQIVRQGELSNNRLVDLLELMGLAGAPGLERVVAQYRGACPDLSPLLWTPTFREQRGTPEFFDVMEQLGVVDAWREFGWPDDCASLDQTLAECPE